MAAVPLTANAAAASISTFVSVVQLTDAVTRKKGFNALNTHLTVAFAAVVAVNLLAAACFPYLGVVLTMRTAGVFFTCTVIGGAGLMLGLTALKKAGWL